MSVNQEFSVRSKYHGSISLIMIFTALVIGTVTIFSGSRLWGWIYLGIIAVGFLLIRILFCTKCPERVSGCPHILPGFLTRLFPQRKKKPYSATELAGTLLPILLWVLIPQYWIWESMLIGILFWLLLLIPVVQIRIVLCPECSNQCCPVKFTL